MNGFEGYLRPCRRLRFWECTFCTTILKLPAWSPCTHDGFQFWPVEVAWRRSYGKWIWSGDYHRCFCSRRVTLHMARRAVDCSNLVMPWSNPDRYSCTAIRSSQPKVTHFLRSYRHRLNSIPFPNNRSNYAFVSSSRISRDYLRCLNRGNFLVSFATRLVAFWCSHVRSNATSHCPASAPCCSGLFIFPTWYIANEFGKVNLGSVARMM